MMRVAPGLWRRWAVVAIAVVSWTILADARSARKAHRACRRRARLCPDDVVARQVSFGRRTMGWRDFDLPDPACRLKFGPVVTEAMALPSGRGVEMVAAVEQLEPSRPRTRRI